jgi:uncharacterized cupin superfamily protein
MRRFNVHMDALEHRSDDDGYRWRGMQGLGERLGARRIGASLYELPEGELSFPYHFHHGVEEWLYVLAGAPVVRTPDSRRTLAPGDLICFPSGSTGAHSVRGPGRVLMFSADRVPSISVFPDSDKIGTRPGDRADHLNFRRGEAVDYWEGE